MKIQQEIGRLAEGRGKVCSSGHGSGQRAWEWKWAGRSASHSLRETTAITKVHQERLGEPRVKPLCLKEVLPIKTSTFLKFVTFYLVPVCTSLLVFPCGLVAAHILESVSSYSLDMFYSWKECDRSELTEPDGEQALKFKVKTTSLQWPQLGSLHEQMQKAPVN